MMRRFITRTLQTSTISGFGTKIVEGKPVIEELEPIVVTGKVSTKEALKALKDVYGKESNIIVSDIQVLEEAYEISVNDFIKYAKKIETK